MREKIQSVIEIARNEGRQPRQRGGHIINGSLAELEMAYLVFSAAQDREKSGGKTIEGNRRDCYLFRKMKGIMEIHPPRS